MTEPKKRKPKPATGKPKPSGKPKGDGAAVDWPTRLKALRDRLGLSQAEAAARIRVNHVTWSGWENGRHVPPGPVQLLVEMLESGRI